MDDPPDLSKEITRQYSVDDWPLSCKQQVAGSSLPGDQIRRSQA